MVVKGGYFLLSFLFLPFFRCCSSTFLFIFYVLLFSLTAIGHTGSFLWSLRFVPWCFPELVSQTSAPLVAVLKSMLIRDSLKEMKDATSICRLLFFLSFFFFSSRLSLSSLKLVRGRKKKKRMLDAIIIYTFRCVKAYACTMMQFSLSDLLKGRSGFCTCWKK